MFNSTLQNQSKQEKPLRKSVLIEINNANKNLRYEAFDNNLLYQKFFTPA